ncbi:MAG: Gfo/Idh/MocA family oxidoreductase [Planctomycetota bacterium]
MSKEVVRLGIVGLDGHGSAFAEKVNGRRPALKGARVVAAISFPSVMVSRAVLRDKVEKTRSLGIEIVKSPDALAQRVDGILILHDDGAQHLALAKLFARFRKPLFVDKPFEASARKAAALVALCRSHRTPLFSASSLRFSREIEMVLSDNAAGPILSAMTYAPYVVRPTMPGWIYYACHAVEPLYTLMGPRCREVRCLMSPSGPVAVGTWADGRVGIARAVAKGEHSYGFTVWRKKRTLSASVRTEFIYAELLKRILTFVKTRLSPVPPSESAETVAFMEAANKSMANKGRSTPVA